ncbi:MAG: DNA polymerase III subunit delta [Rhodospirillaceae bacterium]
MKIQTGRADSFAVAPDTNIQAILVYGPDIGLVYERAKILANSVLGGSSDPFRLTDLNASTIKADPSRLAEEAAAMALTGGRRVVKVRDATDAITKTVEKFLDATVGDTLLVFTSGELGPRSTLRRVFEKASNAAALPCYADDNHALDQLIRETFKEAGFALEQDARAFLADHLGGDRALSRRELEKLVVYKGTPSEKGDVRVVTLEDAMDCVGDTAAFDLDDLVYAMADGDQVMVQRVFGRMISEGTSPISILTAASRHLMRLHHARGLCGDGIRLDQVVMKLRPPVFFKRKGQFKAQAARWNGKLLARALELLTTAELHAKSTDMPARALIERALMQVSSAAKSARLKGTH